MQDRRQRANQLIDELQGAHHAVLDLVGMRSTASGFGEPHSDTDRPVDEAFHEEWQAALARQKAAWDAWSAFIADGPW